MQCTACLPPQVVGSPRPHPVRPPRTLPDVPGGQGRDVPPLPLPAAGTTASGSVDGYEALLRSPSLRSRWIRYWFAPGRVLFLNTPVRHMHRLLPMSPDSSILDVGCGAGGLLIHLQKQAGIRRTMEGVDASPAMVDWARREMARHGIGDRVDIRLASGTDLPFPEDRFDAVFCTYVIKHLSDPGLKLMLCEVHRVLKPGGAFCMWEAGPTRPAILDRLNRWLISDKLFPVTIRSSDELRSLLLDHGFRNVRAYGHAPYLYHPMMRRVGFVCRT